MTEISVLFLRLLQTCNFPRPCKDVRCAKNSNCNKVLAQQLMPHVNHHMPEIKTSIVNLFIYYLRCYGVLVFNSFILLHMHYYIDTDIPQEIQCLKISASSIFDLLFLPSCARFIKYFANAKCIEVGIQI